MEVLKDIGEALSYLKEGELLTSNGHDRFVLKNGKIFHYENGTRFVLNPNDFIELYKKSRFFLYEEAVDEMLAKTSTGITGWLRFTSEARSLMKAIF